MRKAAKFSAGLLIAVFFLWLVIRNIDIREVIAYMQGISYWWLAPYTIVAILSHYIRSERWRLLVKRQGIEHQRNTLFAGVMVGYLINYAVPRLGEVSRSVYVAQKTEMSTSDVLGTVVLERVIDFACMLVLVGWVVVYIVTDMATLQRLFGEETFAYLNWLGEWQQLFGLILLAITGLLLIYLGYLAIKVWRKKSETGRRIAERIEGALKNFIYGLTAIFRMKNWPAFVISTILIWLGYALMAYIPFTAFGLTTEYGLGFTQALVVMIISAIGVALPSPGGVGTYHWFVTQTLVVLYSVPVTIGIAYAFVTHAVMMILVVVFTPIIVLLNTGGKINLSFIRRSL